MDKYSDRGNNFVFKTYRNPLSSLALANFEKVIMRSIKKLKLSRYTIPFQKLMSEKVWDKVLPWISHLIRLITCTQYHLSLIGIKNSGYKYANKNALGEINSSHLEIISNLGLLDRTQPYNPKTPRCLLKPFHYIDLPNLVRLG